MLYYMYMKIIQITAAYEGNDINTVYGLGEDNQVYYLVAKNCCWKLWTS